MPRANRHYFPGYLWHLTHRCHKRENLLEARREKLSWLEWLMESKKRFRLCVLDYTVTSNHVHLLVSDRGVFQAIPRAMQLIASRSAQEYNFRQSRRGAFWEDRYHSTLIENGVHLVRCITYIDLNMVRAGIVQHPADWEYGGFREIQGLQSKFDLVDLNDLLSLISCENIDHLRKTHITDIERAIDGRNLTRDKIWTESVAVGSKAFVETIKKKLGGSARRSKISEGKDIFTLREERSAYVWAPLQNANKPRRISCQPKQLIIK